MLVSSFIGKTCKNVSNYINISSSVAFGKTFKYNFAKSNKSLMDGIIPEGWDINQQGKKGLLFSKSLNGKKIVDIGEILKANAGKDVTVEKIGKLLESKHGENLTLVVDAREMGENFLFRGIKSKVSEDKIKEYTEDRGVPNKDSITLAEIVEHVGPNTGETLVSTSKYEYFAKKFAVLGSVLAISSKNLNGIDILSCQKRALFLSNKLHKGIDYTKHYREGEIAVSSIPNENILAAYDVIGIMGCSVLNKRFSVTNPNFNCVLLQPPEDGLKKPSFNEIKLIIDDIAKKHDVPKNEDDIPDSILESDVVTWGK